jgi:hypothetical protein
MRYGFFLKLHAQVKRAIMDYDMAWASWRAEALLKESYPSIFHGYYFNLPNEPAEPGLDETVDWFRNQTFAKSSIS